jgi:hypothetical protein
MKTETIVMCIVALILGILIANMLKSVCGCKIVEGSSNFDCSWTTMYPGACDLDNTDGSAGWGNCCLKAETKENTSLIYNNYCPIKGSTTSGDNWYSESSVGNSNNFLCDKEGEGAIYLPINEWNRLYPALSNNNGFNFNDKTARSGLWMIDINFGTWNGSLDASDHNSWDAKKQDICESFYLANRTEPGKGTSNYKDSGTNSCCSLEIDILETLWQNQYSQVGFPSTTGRGDKNTNYGWLNQKSDKKSRTINVTSWTNNENEDLQFGVRAWRSTKGNSGERRGKGLKLDDYSGFPRDEQGKTGDPKKFATIGIYIFRGSTNKDSYIIFFGYDKIKQKFLYILGKYYLKNTEYKWDKLTPYISVWAEGTGAISAAAVKKNKDKGATGVTVYKNFKYYNQYDFENINDNDNDGFLTKLSNPSTAPYIKE